MDIKKQDQPPQEPMDLLPESRRSGPPPPPSRRAPIPPGAQASSSAAPASEARPLKPRLGSTPIAEQNRVRDPVRALHERELALLREQHEQALAQALLEKDAELAAQHLAHQTHTQALILEQEAQLQTIRAEAEAHLISMRRRVAAAAHLALEDRQGSLRYLEDENESLRARVHELEQQLDLPATIFSARPRTPSLPPEMFISPSLPPPVSSAAAPLGAPAKLAPSAPPDRRRESPDDLTRLRGVGPAIARGLIQLGVTKFSQIASWTDADIERIAPRLRTRPNRIRKDGWVISAQLLQKEQQLRNEV